MNGRERLAGAALIITLTIGIVASVLHRAGIDNRVAVEDGPHLYDSCGGSTHAYRRLNINSATVQQLTALPGIGPKRAGAIVDWRECNGPFASVDDLTDVKGVGEKTLAVIRMYVCVDEESVGSGK